jgi:hypothetical protein
MFEKIKNMKQDTGDNLDENPQDKILRYYLFNLAQNWRSSTVFIEQRTIPAPLLQRTIKAPLL